MKMLVDDVEVDSENLPASTQEIVMGGNSQLYFGGVEVDIEGKAASTQGLVGCISDIIANER